MHGQEIEPFPEGCTDRSKYTGLQIRVVALAFLTALLDGLDLQIIAYAAPAMARDLRLAETSLGVIFSGGFAGLAAGSMLIAPLGDRWGRRTIMILCLLLFGACVLATPLAENAEQLFVLRVVTGLGLGGVMPNAIAISMEFSPARLRASMVSLTYFGFIIGAAVGGIVAASLIPLMGWKGMLYIVGALPLALALIEFFFLPESPEYLSNRRHVADSTARIQGDRIAGSIEQKPAPRTSPMRAIFSAENRRNSALMWIAMFANLSIAFAVVQWLPTILSRTGFALENANSLVGLMWVSAVPGVVILLYLSKRIGLQRSLGSFLCIGSVVTCALGAVIAASASDAVWLLMIGFGMTLAGAQVGFYSLLAAVYPGSSRVTGIGWAQGVGRLGAVVGPAAIGLLLADGMSIVILFVYLSIPVLVSAVAVWNVRLRRSPAEFF
jgi:AAHS family 4-hydroxybenzoate transporter-like MFS transporter